MLEFRKIMLSDKEHIELFLKKSNYRGCEYTFGNNFVWSKAFNVEICFKDEFYICKQGRGADTRFIYPAGNGSVKTAVNLLLGYTAENKLPLKIIANKKNAEKITELYPNAGSTLNRDFCDYVYTAEDLAELKGKKYHGKRNHLNRFYENNWSLEPLCIDNIAECKEMLKLWADENLNGDDDAGKLAELSVVELSLEHYNELGYMGGVLRVDGKVSAFTFGEPSSDDCFVVHVEKALREHQGAYAAINREFVKSLNGKYKYINREEDTGSENLRKAKLSYHPVFLEEKFVIEFNGN